MRIAWLGAGAALSFVIAAGCSTQEHTSAQRTRSTSQAIQGGTLDTTHKFAVGVSSGGGICSGALIAPNVVVTARHCVQSIDYKNPKVPGTIDCSLNPTFVGGIKTMSVTTDSDFQGATFRSVKQVIVPTTTNAVCGSDIALLVLNNLIPSTTAKPAIPGVQYAVNYSKYSQYFTAIGYGNTSANGGGAGTRRILQLISIQCIPGDPFKDCPAEFSGNEFVAGDGTCSGDSGSAAYEQNSINDEGTGSIPIALGVLSRGGEDQTLCVGSIYTRLDKFRDFIINNVKTASNNWSLYPEPSWTTYVPPEVTDAGTAKPDSGTKPATPTEGLPFGETCDVDADCESKLCEGTCTQACTTGDDATCPDGYHCDQDLCFVNAAPVAEPTQANNSTTTTEGCSTTGASTPWSTLVLAAAVGVGIGVGGRRRRRS